MKPVILALGLLMCFAQGLRAETPAPGHFYDPDPGHLWNRLNDTLFVRTAPDGTRYGVGELDILFWSHTQHLLAGRSHEEAVRILDEFIRNHGEALVGDPLKRALLQRDLWQLFDWTALPRHESAAFADERAALQERLAVIIRRLALSAKEIAVLPDNYARAEASEHKTGFPRGLFQSKGDWLIVGASRNDATAMTHTMDFGGRSIFLVLVRFPEGRQQAVSYLNRLRDFEPALIYWKVPGQDRHVLMINPAVPQFPINTEWVLVRRLCVIDQQGEIRPTPLIEGIQRRRYVSIPSAGTADSVDRESAVTAQQFAEFEMDRRHEAALRPIAPDEKDFQFVHFRSMGIDPFEFMDDRGRPQDVSRFRSETLGTCSRCHQAPGVLSVHSYNRRGFATFPIQVLEGSNVDQESADVLDWKHRQSDWRLLQSLWRQVDQTNPGVE